MNTESIVPEFKEWAAKHGTPWTVTFPRNGAVARKRRFFATEEAANTAISEWKKGVVSHGLGKRKVDEFLYAESMLPPGVTLRDAVQFYLAHHSAASSTTVEDVSKLYLSDIRGKSEDYRAEMARTVAEAVEALGPTTVFSAVSKATLLAYIKAGESYWVRYSRKRAVSVLVTKAREIEAIRANPLDGWKFEDAPKATPHFLKKWEVETILDYAAETAPHLVVPFAFQLYAGIRTEELCRNVVGSKRPLRWGDVSVGKSITVPVEVSKTNDRRVVDYWPAALSRRVLASAGAAEEPVCSVAELDDAKSKLIRALNKDRASRGLPEVDFRQNDFRRTYATNSVQVFGGEKTKERLGHQEPSKVLKKHYDGLTTKEEAEAYFA